jgi:pyruvate/2-oxoacid:ferredoxin oxidoreductase beta subunit
MEGLRTLRQFGIEVPEAEYAPPGHTACAGCPGAAMMRQMLKLLGPKVVLTNPASCSGYFARAVEAPLCRCLFEVAAASGTGIRAALDVRGDKETIVLVWAGDGGTADIGIQALSAAAERNEDFIYACYDNEGYMMTGMQRSSATPAGAWTTTTPLPQPKKERKKDIVGIMAAHRIPYVATATIAYPEDLIRKVLKAKKIRGTRFFNLLAPCPTGWRFPTELSVKLARMAVESRVFPLLEVEDGVRWTLQKPQMGISVRDYIKAQGRFAHLSEAEIESIERSVHDEWELLLAKPSRVCEL